MSGELRAAGRTNKFLTDVRAVHTRAETTLKYARRQLERGPDEWMTQEDIDLMVEMIADLEAVVAQLDKWRRK